MKVYTQYFLNPFEYLGDFRNMRSNNLQLEMIGIGSDYIRPSESKCFDHFAINMTKTIIENHCNNFYFYFLIIIEVPKLGSRIAEYRKVWKTLEFQELPISHFFDTSEIEFVDNGQKSYLGIAKFKIEDLDKTYKIWIKHRFSTVIFLSQEEINQQSFLQTIWNLYVNKKILDFKFRNLCLCICENNKIIFRLGDDSESREIDIIYKKNLININKDTPTYVFEF